MKKFSYILAALIIAGSSAMYAQTATGTPDANYSIYKNKLKKSEEQKDHPKKSAKPKFWIDRAELMMDIFSLHRDYLSQGTQQMHITLIYGQPNNKKTWTEEGSNFEEWTYDKVTITFKDGVVSDFKETEILVEDPLPDALSSLKKAEELDTENKESKDIKENYDLLKAKYERQGIEQFFDEDYKGAFKSFATIHEINQNPLMEGVVDTTLVYYAGMAASRADMTDESIKYYEIARENNYPEADLYIFLKAKYFEKGDSAAGVAALEEGWQKFPDNQAVLIELINYYLLSGREDEALEYLKIAQEEDPENLSFIFAEGTLYDKTGDIEKAREAYERCLEIDPDYFNAYYNLGVMYYNEAVEMYQKAEKINTPKEYGEAVDAADAVLAKSLPYMEKASEIQPDDKGTLETLKTLYYRLKMTEKYEEVKAKLDSMPAEEKGM